MKKSNIYWEFLKLIIRNRFDCANGARKWSRAPENSLFRTFLGRQQLQNNRKISVKQWVFDTKWENTTPKDFDFWLWLWLIFLEIEKLNWLLLLTFQVFHKMEIYWLLWISTFILQSQSQSQTQSHKVSPSFAALLAACRQPCHLPH